MTVKRSFEVVSSQHPAVTYHVTINDTPHPDREALSIGLVIMCDGHVIYTGIGWQTPDQNIAIPGLNHGDLGKINVANQRMVTRLVNQPT